MVPPDTIDESDFVIPHTVPVMIVVILMMQAKERPLEIELPTEEEEVNHLDDKTTEEEEVIRAVFYIRPQTEAVGTTQNKPEAGIAFDQSV